MRHRLTRQARGFTLLELIVAMTIVAVLASFTINLTKQARLAAHKTACASNLRQLGVAVSLYLNDNDNRFPPYVQKTREGNIWYFGRESGGGGAEGERELDREAGPLYPYIQQVGSIEVCPAFNYNNALYKAKDTHYVLQKRARYLHRSAHPGGLLRPRATHRRHANQ